MCPNFQFNFIRIFAYNKTLFKRTFMNNKYIGGIRMSRVNLIPNHIFYCYKIRLNLRLSSVLLSLIGRSYDKG